MVVFRDIKPASPHHYLVVPKQHIPDPKILGNSHVELGKWLTHQCLMYPFSLGFEWVHTARFKYGFPKCSEYKEKKMTIYGQL